MAALVEYGSSGEEEEEDVKEETETLTATSLNYNDSSKVLSSLKERISINSTPSVPNKETETNLLRIDPSAKEIAYNPTYEQLFTPQLGPSNPFKTQQQRAHKNSLAGFVEPAHFDGFQFENQRRTFQTYGYAVDPTAEKSVDDEQFIGEIEKISEEEGVTVFEKKVVRTGEKRKREDKGTPDDIDGYKGPWREYIGQVKVACPSKDQMIILEAQKGERLKQKKVVEEETIEETSILHIDNPLDYMGRSFLHIPQDVDVNLKADEPPERCYVPKKLIYTWTDHTRGVSTMTLFPKSGHLVLSAGMDASVRLFEVYHERRCIRTYWGHAKAVRDVCFNNDGTQFLSCGYDRYIKLWDTETGHCISRFSNSKTPYCVKFNPDDDKQNLFVVGCSDKKIYTWDTKSEEIVQEYDRHLGAVNTITFVDENRRFVTTSDDKSLRVWEWDIPVDTKYVAEPHMHSMPAVTLGPNGKWLACQSMDNQILCYGVHTNFRLNRRKCFKGHNVAGYACQLDFSPDCSYVVSGEADGKVCFWDWKTKKIWSKLKAHDGVCICVKWLPHETSKILTCGWDGAVKLWD